MKTPVRRTIAAVALLFAAPAVTACAQGFGAQTDQQYQPVDGVTAHLDGVDVIAAAIVAGDDGKGTLSAGLVADEDDTLAQVSGSGVTVTGLPTEVTANKPVNLAKEGVVVEGDDVEPGNYVELTFTFAGGESTKLSVPVVTNSGDYADVELPKGSTPAPSTEEPVGTHEEGTEPSSEESEDAAH